MIATILQSSPTFNAVLYNEHKVQQGSAVLLEMKNFGDIQTLGYDKPQELQNYLIQYSERNKRVKNAQFHLAISCKGEEWSHEELVEFAHSYLDEMGYGDPDQPLLIYAHHDTDNNHIHIVSSRVAPNGKKINDSKERIRSQKVLEKLLKQDVKRQAEKDIAAAMQFEFTDMRQFKSIMEAMNYQCYESGDKLTGTLNIKKGGRVLAKIPKTEITRRIGENGYNRNKDKWQKERMKTRSILHREHDAHSDKAGLEKELHKKIGLSLVWLGPKDNPFGYQVVDFANKKVYDGNSLMYVRDLLDFKSRQEHEEEIRNLIFATLDKDPYISTKDLNRVLRKAGGYIKKNYFGFGNHKVLLDEKTIDTLKRNNKIAWGRKFNPASDEEVALVCRLSKLPYPEFFPVIPQDGAYKNEECKEVFDLLSKEYNSVEEKREAFAEACYSYMKTDDGAFIVNFSKSVIIDISKTGWPEFLYADLIPQKSGYTHNGQTPQKSAPQSQSKKSDLGRNAEKLLKERLGSGHSANREWEVGKKEADRDDPDRNNQLGY